VQPTRQFWSTDSSSVGGTVVDTLSIPKAFGIRDTVLIKLLAPLITLLNHL